MISMHEAIPKQCPKHSGKQCKLSNARTYVRTYKQLLILISNLTLGNARRGGSQKSSDPFSFAAGWETADA